MNSGRGGARPGAGRPKNPTVEPLRAPPKKRGGARKGAGRPKQNEYGMSVRVVLMVTPSLAKRWCNIAEKSDITVSKLVRMTMLQVHGAPRGDLVLTGRETPRVMTQILALQDEAMFLGTDRTPAADRLRAALLKKT